MKIFIDYKSFIYFIKSRDLNRRQTKYLNILFEYNIKIIYRLNPQNIKADIFIRISGFKLINLANERLK